MNRLLATDGYHLTMGYLMGEQGAWERESHTLYARTGGPQVVPNLREIVADYLADPLTLAEVEEAAAFWEAQGVPFASEAWRQLARLPQLPITVRGVVDGEVVGPGEPIAVIEAPALLAAVPEPVLLGRLQKAMQITTRFTKAACAVSWERQRLFEVGLRAANSVADHDETVALLASVGLRLTSSGEAALRAGIAAGGSMGHRYTQRFANDESAFAQALEQILAYRRARPGSGRVKLSLLLDTWSTLGAGLPAAVRLIEARFEEIRSQIDLSVRLDSGDLEAQLRAVMRTFLAAFAGRGWLPGIIVESGLTPPELARFEAIAAQERYPREKLIYGLGGYLVGGISRDFVSLVYKVSSIDGVPTMKFGDESEGGKQSYPGDLTLLERERDGLLVRQVALREEVAELQWQGWRDCFIDIARDGVVVAPEVTAQQRIARIEQRWGEIGRGYLGEERYPAGFARRPQLSGGVARLVAQLRQRAGGQTEETEDLYAPLG